MKRDPDLLRDQLIFLTEHLDGRNQASSTDFRKRFPEFNVYILGDHVHQLCENGFVDGKVHFFGADSPPRITITRITTCGHDFLASTKNDRIWRNAIDEVVKRGTAWTLGLLAEYVKARTKEYLNLS